MMSATMLSVARTDALFVSALATGSQPGREQVEAVVRTMVRRYHGSRGCAAEVAACYGEVPEHAVRRMTWARRVIATHFTSAR
jgi:hypothetical protein